MNLLAGWGVVACAALGVACAAGRVTPGNGGTPARALWVWSTDRILASPEAQRALFSFSARQGVGALWMQVTTAGVGGGIGADGLRLEVTRAAEWRSLIVAAHDRGLTVEALDGDPTYADGAFHYVPLAITDAVIAFNRGAPPAARFDGLHFDNEPYLLPGWNDPVSREQLLRDYVALTDRIQRRVEQARPLTFGVDLPFWWDVNSASQILARVDSVTLMDYRNEASGPDGLMALATPMLTAAARVGHAEVRVGVETRPFEEARIWFVTGPPAATARDTLGRSWRLRYPGEPFRLRSLEEKGRVHFGVTYPQDSPGPPPPELVQIARDYGTSAGPGIPVPRLPSAEWRAVEPRSIFDSQREILYAGFVATNIPQRKLTFATRPGAFRDETSTAERAFRQFPPYRGLAVHDYDGFRALVPSTRH